MKTLLLALLLLLTFGVDAVDQLPTPVSQWILANNCEKENRRTEIIDQFISIQYESFTMDGRKLGGRQSLKEFLGRSHSAFRNYRLEVLDSATQGSRTWLRLRATGTNVGAVMGIEPSGAEVSVGLVVILEVQNNQITREWLLSDSASLLRQIKGASHRPQ